MSIIGMLDASTFVLGYLGLAIDSTVQHLGLTEEEMDPWIPTFEKAFVVPLDVFAHTGKALGENLIHSGSNVYPETRFRTTFLNYFYHPLGGFPSFGNRWGHGLGFPGDPFFPGHRSGFHPAPHHDHHSGGFFVDLFQPTTADEEAETPPESQVLEDLITLAIFFTSVLVVAPVLEEIVFRQGFYWVRRLFSGFGSRHSTLSETNSKDQRFVTWTLVSSLFFAAAHLPNHLPTSNDMNTVLEEKGNEYAIHQMTIAAVQFCVTFVLSLRVFVPLYEKLGLFAAIGAHFCWNACAIAIEYQCSARVLFAMFRCIGSVVYWLFDYQQKCPRATNGDIYDARIQRLELARDSEQCHDNGFRSEDSSRSWLRDDIIAA